jgi:hypothetical protein
VVRHAAPDDHHPVPVGHGDPGDQLQVEEGGVILGLSWSSVILWLVIFSWLLLIQLALCEEMHLNTKITCKWTSYHVPDYKVRWIRLVSGLIICKHFIHNSSFTLWLYLARKSWYKKIMQLLTLLNYTQHWTLSKMKLAML